MQAEQTSKGIDINELRKLCTDDTITLTQHLSLRLRERGIRYDDVVNVLMGGEIIEQYPTDYPYPSCLLLGVSVGDKYLHVVCGVGSGRLWIVTAYYPSPDKWEAGYKARKGNKQ